MLIAFFVNDMEREHPELHDHRARPQATMRGHRVCYLTPSDFVLRRDDSLCASTPASRRKRKYKDREAFFDDAEGRPRRRSSRSTSPKSTC